MEPEKLLKVRKSIEKMIAEIEQPAKPGHEAEKIDLKNLVCFAVPIWNMVAPMFGLPALPLPAFCNV